MPSDTDHDSLVAQLRELGVCYLTPTDARVDETRRYTAPELIGRLASHPDPRLRHALIAVLIRHPELADEVRKLIDVLDPAARVELVAHYMAAVYLQRMWRTRLGFYLDVHNSCPICSRRNWASPRRKNVTARRACTPWPNGMRSSRPIRSTICRHTIT